MVSVRSFSPKPASWGSDYVFLGFEEFAGEIKNRTKGVLIAMDQCTTVAYALFNLQERGRHFLGPGERVYEGHDNW